jgi:urea transport system permease protein
MMGAACLRVLAILVTLLLPTAARAADLAELVGKLAADDFATKIEAAEALGALGDGQAIRALRALADGRLYTKGGKALVGDGKQFVDALTGAPMADAGDPDKVRVNNRLRNVVTGALSKLALFSPERAERLNAARDAFKTGGTEILGLLEQAIAKESDNEVKAAMRYSLLAAKVGSGTNESRIAAIRELASVADPQVKNLLATLRNTAGTPQPVINAADAALQQIDRKLQFVALAQNLFQGISLGSVLLLAAVGLAITFGVMGVINMAHGEMIMIGAYAAFVVQELFRAYLPPAAIAWYPIAALPVAFLTAGLVGIALERGVISFLYGRPLETLLATWGISLMLQQAVRLTFGAPNREVANPDWLTGGFDLVGGFFVAYNRLAIIIFCFVVLGVIALILRYTPFGLHMRAVTQNRPMASAMGIGTAKVDALTFGLGSGIAGIAGVALSQIGNVSPNLGQIYIVDSFLVVVFGGVGNLLGTLVGAMTLGIVNKILEPVAGAVLGKVAVLIFIILFIQKRPRGLFALRGRAADA